MINQQEFDNNISGTLPDTVPNCYHGLKAKVILNWTKVCNCQFLWHNDWHYSLLDFMCRKNLKKKKKFFAWKENLALPVSLFLLLHVLFFFLAWAEVFTILWALHGSIMKLDCQLPGKKLTCKIKEISHSRPEERSVLRSESPHRTQNHIFEHSLGNEFKSVN